MRRFKKLTALVLGLCFVIALSACSGSKDEYERFSSFENHFYPEEFEEEYSEVTREVLLESGKDYKFFIKSACKDGSLKITSTYSGADDTVYIVNSDSPCEEWLEISAGTTDKITFIINIEADTDGSVIVETHTKQGS